MAPETKILIVDDYASVRADLRTILELLNDVIVVGEAATGEEALRQAKSLEPDIVLMDLEMPGMNGWSAIRSIKASPQAPKIYVLTVHGDPAAEQAAFRAGADAFFVKGQDSDHLLKKLLSFRK
ncbi:MAG: response regulator transcription factor [Chloroflexi bacterium]|nr:response regulator transcription factor [Chloroflexota bacterium]